MAFFCCYQLQEITLPRYMVQVDDCAFAFCKKLTRFTIPGVVERFGNMIFLGCEQLQTIFLPKSFQRYVEENLFPPLTEQQAYIQYM